MPTDSERLSSLETAISTLPEYFKDSRAWREETTKTLAILVNKQGDYQRLCEDDRHQMWQEISDVKTKQTYAAGKSSIANVIISSIVAAGIALGAAIIGKSNGS